MVHIPTQLFLQIWGILGGEWGRLNTRQTARDVHTHSTLHFPLLSNIIIRSKQRAVFRSDRPTPPVTLFLPFFITIAGLLLYHMGEKKFRGLGKTVQADTIRVCSGRYSEPIFRKTIRKFLNGSHLGKLSCRSYISGTSHFSQRRKLYSLSHVSEELLKEIKDFSFYLIG